MPVRSETGSPSPPPDRSGSHTERPGSCRTSRENPEPRPVCRAACLYPGWFPRLIYIYAYLFLSIQKFKRFIVVFRIINQSVVGKNDPLGAAPVSPQRVDVALRINTSFLLRQQSFVIAETASADAFARRVGFQTPAFPPQGFGLFFGDKVGREMAVRKDVLRHLIPGCVNAVLLQFGVFV